MEPYNGGYSASGRLGPGYSSVVLDFTSIREAYSIKLINKVDAAGFEASISVVSKSMGNSVTILAQCDGGVD